MLKNMCIYPPKWKYGLFITMSLKLRLVLLLYTHTQYCR